VDAAPIHEAEKLLSEIRQVRPLTERGAWAIDNQRRLAAGLEHLLEYIRGYQQGSMAEQRRLVQLVSSLLAAIAPLFEARQQTPFGEPSAHAAWLSGTAPRLRRAFTEATEYLHQEGAP
jgi:hypothetical protein